METESQTTIQQNTQEHTSDNNESEFKRYFVSSTYGYLLYCCDDGSLAELLLGILTLISQYGLLGIIIAQAREDLKKDEVPVTVGWSNCNDFNTDYKTFPPSKLLQCQATADLEWCGFLLTLVFVSYFVAGDFFRCMKIIFFGGCCRHNISKMLTLPVLAENCLVIYAAILVGYYGAHKGDRYAAISNCIGILFVNDIDEKLYEATKVLFLENKESSCYTEGVRKCWNHVGPFFCTAVFVGLVVIVGAIWEEFSQFTFEETTKLENYAYFDGDNGSVFNETDPILLCKQFVCAIDVICCGVYYEINPVCVGLSEALCEGSYFSGLNVTHF